MPVARFLNSRLRSRHGSERALIAARVAQPSRSRPRHPLSRKKLADLVNRYVWDHYRQQTPIDENHIGKLERGRALARRRLSRGHPCDLGVLRMSVNWAFDPVVLNRLTARNRRERVRRCRSSVRPRASVPRNGGRAVPASLTGQSGAARFR